MLVEEMGRGIDLLFAIDDRVYSRPSKTSGRVGEHFRHNINFVEALLAGIREGAIDYSMRYRDPIIESKRLYAAERMAEMAIGLKTVPLEKMPVSVGVVSELDPTLLHRSTISREVEFVHSHTVHHHALIREKLARWGIEAGADFGVAPSTLKYWAQRSAPAGPIELRNAYGENYVKYGTDDQLGSTDIGRNYTLADALL